MSSTTMTPITTGSGHDTEPSFSPDGNRIAFRSKRDDSLGDIWVMDASGANQTRLSASSSSYDHDPDWSSTNKIVFVSYRSGNDELYLIDMSAPGTVTQLTHTANVDELEPAFSPDGSRIVYTRDNGSGNVPIWVMNADGSGQTQLTFAGAEDEDPSWSPDGTKIAFTRNDQVWIMNADGSGQAQLTSGGEDGHPAWSPDGTKIAFTRGPDSNRQIYYLEVASPNNVLLLLNLAGGNESLEWFKKP